MRLLGALFLLTLSFKANAVDIFTTPKAEAVMSRKYTPANEINFTTSYFPVGAYNKYVALGGSYSLLLNSSHSWELINAFYMVELESNLKKTLQTTPPFNQPPFNEISDNLAAMNFLVTTNYVYSPFYTKALAFNRSIVHTQTSFAIGGGVGGYNIGTFPVADFGLIQRFFYGDRGSFKFDVRFYKFFADEETVYDHLSLGLSYTFML